MPKNHTPDIDPTDLIAPSRAVLLYGLSREFLAELISSGRIKISASALREVIRATPKAA